ncbi:sodium:proton antiporter [Rhizobium sp. Root708]|uniref:Na+/H+ antiporter NhaA n=1 Tax=Rhizobium sp. Root708 TaxID=1736592 RepID=UPI0006FCE406|nr:Na+/H+ antiporter NhaA [Rhizobium sp. Root708]KRB56604.1 sodium:proton antiporter [Rhizobium sp. Root708]
MYRAWKQLEEYSLLLIIGAVCALAWANLSPVSYHALIEFPIWQNAYIGDLQRAPAGTAARVVTVHFLVNDVLMALFFALAGKEVWEAVALRNGALRGKKALTPLFATAGGMLGPIIIYLTGVAAVGQMNQLAGGWAIPTATDIAFSYLVGRAIFGARHPAVTFLLLLAIADDAAGLLILAVFYPQGDLAPGWLLLSAVTALAAYLVANRLPRMLDAGRPGMPFTTAVRKHLSFWPYAAAGAISWYGFHQAGIHPALGLLPIIPAIPHSDIEFGLFAEIEKLQTDLLNVIEHALKGPVQVVLFLFGLANAGVEFSTIGAPTLLVASALMIGKPLGIALPGWVAAGPLGFGLPSGMNYRDLIVLGCVAAIGFTVSLFVASVAFPTGEIQDAAKMGALLSFAAAGISFIMARLLSVEKKS